jgi:WD40 repeat protein
MWNADQSNPARRTNQPFRNLVGRSEVPESNEPGLLHRLGLGFIADLLYSDGSEALMVAEGGTVLVDLSTGKSQWELDCGANCAALSPDGSLLALGRRAKIWIWNLREQRVEQQLFAHDRVSSLAFSPDGRVLASGDYELVMVWDLANGRELRRLLGHEHSVSRLEFSADGKLLVSSDGAYVLQIWDTSTWAQVRRYRGTNFAISCNGQLLAISSTLGPDQSQLEVFDLPNRRRLSGVKYDFLVHRLKFSPDSALLAVGSTALHFLDGRSLDKLSELGGHPLGVGGLAFSPDGGVLTSAGRDGSLRVWDVKQRHETFGVAPPVSTIAGHQLAFSGDRKQLYSADTIGNIHIWDSASWRQQLKFEAHVGRVHSLAVSPDKMTLASCGADGTLRIWDAATGHQRQAFEVHGGDVYGVAISGDGQLLLSGGADGTALLWELAHGRKLRQFIGHDGPVNYVAFSPDRTIVATESFDETLRLWEVSTGNLIHTCRHRAILQGIAFRTGGKEVITSDADRIVRRWDVASGRELARHELGDGSSTPFAYDAIADRIAVAGWYNGAIQILAANTGRLLQQITGHYTECLDFGPHGQCLASAGSDGAIRIWNVPATGQGG